MEIKIALVGANSVGKTSFISRLSTDKFQSEEDYVDFYYQVNGGIIYNFVFTDIEKADYILLMFDLSNIDSFNYVDEFLQKKYDKDIILLGNKCDLVKIIKELDCPNKTLYSNIEKYLNSGNIIKYYYISALSFKNYTKPFDYIIDKYNDNHNDLV